MSTLMNFAEMGLTVKNSTTVKTKAKESLEAFLIKALREYYGEGNVSEVFKDGNNMKGKALSVGIGIVEDNGFEIEVCVNVELTAKSITETTRKTSTGISVTPIYDRLTEADLYASEMERKQKEKNEKKAKADSKKKKDKEAREKAKAKAQTKTSKEEEEEEVKTDTTEDNVTTDETNKTTDIVTATINETEEVTTETKATTETEIVTEEVTADGKEEE